MKKILLASQSPRRREILTYFGLPFTSASPFFDEEAEPVLANPVQYGHKLSEGKARSCEREYPDYLILSADTLVFQAGRYFGKPKDRQEARMTLETLSGKAHEVITSVSTLSQGKLRQEAAITRVFFAPLSEGAIEAFLDTGLWVDKAGGYAIQGIGSLLVERIEGCFYNVVGFPIQVVQKLLLQEGVDLWHHGC
jgi:septum formation protein